MKHIYLLIFILGSFTIHAQKPDILNNEKVRKKNYLPDFSYAGYKSGESFTFNFYPKTILNVLEFGAIPDDGLDDTKALKKVMYKAGETQGPTLIQFPAGKFILSEVLYIDRSDLMIRGAGSGARGTVIYCPRPMNYMQDPEPLKELREYLLKMDKRQKEPQNNIDLPFSQYAWSGGMIWTHVPGERVKTYLSDYNKEKKVLAHIESGRMGELEIVVDNAGSLHKGDVVQLEWYNKEGKEGSLLKALYDVDAVTVGSHHWEYPNEPLVKQQVRLMGVKGNKLTLSAPLLLDIKEKWEPAITEWKHLENIGIEHLRFEFPMAPNIAHHVEEGYNAMYFTRVFDGWIEDVVIKNADSGILTEESASLTIKNITTIGKKIAHYSVYIGGVHNVLVANLKVYNEVRHSLSFNTLSTKNVYKNCEVYSKPVLDQHAGANHQNLFDNIRIYPSLNDERSYPLFKGGGAGYWKPSHGAFSTFWNIQIHFKDGLEKADTVLLNGMNDGSYARIIGVSGNLPVKIDYGPKAYIEKTNQRLRYIPSLYDYQLRKRLGNKK